MVTVVQLCKHTRNLDSYAFKQGTLRYASYIPIKLLKISRKNKELDEKKDVIYVSASEYQFMSLKGSMYIQTPLCGVTQSQTRLK